jgi:phage terminase small subunit
MRPSSTMLAISAAALVIGATAAQAGPCTQQINEVAKQLSASDAGSGPTTGSPAPTTGNQEGRHPPTDLMSKESEGKAATPRDVLRQTGIKADASKALDRARQLDSEGKESACMDAVKSARELAQR